MPNKKKVKKSKIMLARKMMLGRRRTSKVKKEHLRKEVDNIKRSNHNKKKG